MESQQQNHPSPINANEVLVHNQDAPHVVNNLGGGGGIGAGNSKNMSGNSSNYMCRQSSTRWTPTTEQIRILKELYYNNGIRSPTADQIQRISARLRQYGKIEGKNVFYWFQNHKARERQKKRFTGIGNDLHPHPPSMNVNFPSISRSTTANPHHYIYNKNKHLYPNISPPPPGIPSSSCSSPAGVVGVAQIGNYGSLAMEKSFRDCSISQGETQSCGWVGVDPYSPTYHSFLDKRSKPFEHHETLEEDVEDEQAPEIETLPLFPMHGGGNDFNSNNGFFNVNKSASSDSSAYYTGSWYRSAGGDYPTGASRASLELSLNSYTGWSSMDLHN